MPPRSFPWFGNHLQCRRIRGVPEYQFTTGERQEVLTIGLWMLAQSKRTFAVHYSLREFSAVTGTTINRHHRATTRRRNA